MAQLMRGNVWLAWDHYDLILITTSQTLSAKGHLIMGGSVAAQAAERWPTLPAKLGRIIKQRGPHYALIISDGWPNSKLGCFQNKYEHHEKPSMVAIAFAANALTAWHADHPDAVVALPFPGNGSDRARVVALLKDFPNNIHIWEYDSIVEQAQLLGGEVLPIPLE